MLQKHHSIGTSPLQSPKHDRTQTSFVSGKVPPRGTHREASYSEVRRIRTESDERRTSFDDGQDQFRPLWRLSTFEFTELLEKQMRSQDVRIQAMLAGVESRLSQQAPAHRFSLSTGAMLSSAHTSAAGSASVRESYASTHLQEHRSRAMVDLQDMGDDSHAVTLSPSRTVGSTVNLTTAPTTRTLPDLKDPRSSGETWSPTAVASPHLHHMLQGSANNNCSFEDEMGVRAEEAAQDLNGVAAAAAFAARRSASFEEASSVAPSTHAAGDKNFSVRHARNASVTNLGGMYVLRKGWLEQESDIEFMDQMNHADMIDGDYKIGCKKNFTMQSNDDRPFPARNMSMLGSMEAYNCSRRMMLRPSGLVRLAWDIISLIFIGYDTITIPYILAFNPPEDSAMVAIFWAVLIFWTGDIWMCFSTGYYANGEEEMRRSSVAWHYIKTWFLLDAAIVTIDWIGMILQAGRQEGVAVARFGKTLRTMRVLRSLRLLRVMKLRRVVDMIQDHIASDLMQIVVTMTKLVLLVLLVNHAFACIWYWLGSGQWNEKEGWATEFLMSQQPLSYRYATSLHWSLTQFTTGSMEIYPTTLQDDHDLQVLRRYLKIRRIKAHLSIRIMHYVEHQIMERAKLIQDSEVQLLTIISKPLEKELKQSLMSPFLEKHHFFRLYAVADDHAMQQACFAAVKTVPLSYGDLVFAPRSADGQMYFVSRGSLSYSAKRRLTQSSSMATSSAHKSTSVASRATAQSDFLAQGHDILEVDDWCCEGALWTHWVHVGTLRATENAEVLAVKGDEFANATNSFFYVRMNACTYARLYVSRLNEIAFGSPSAAGMGITDLADMTLINTKHIAHEAFGIHDSSIAEAGLQAFYAVGKTLSSTNNFFSRPSMTNGLNVPPMTSEERSEELQSSAPSRTRADSDRVSHMRSSSQKSNKSSKSQSPVGRVLSNNLPAVGHTLSSNPAVGHTTSNGPPVVGHTVSSLASRASQTRDVPIVSIGEDSGGFEVASFGHSERTGFRSLCDSSGSLQASITSPHLRAAAPSAQDAIPHGEDSGVHIMQWISEQTVSGEDGVRRKLTRMEVSL
mmetsp:Transcript_15785/g.37126  ORF Transcript_15785/g.37126 Transcript_15785/m.37126 type:complete len:1074 (+) Transcript_15785:132-3353(+)|eukprot:CAMPEP_0178387430 /NCGR_PEP_ID=MMETSP0689_2-20121128/9070_1 /TAXON_ID=160604 /ORGANISM="Amphidinium massartii, Strain CS-259" /LENGTH=1073 /DNA_ID=CAMNT_0020007795 /DNA_START=47 /DNA_END=3268 /DNA_ORIENTATION=+